MDTGNRQLVLILGAESGPTDELARAINARCGDRVEFRYATNVREAQRRVREDEFVAIVAAEHGFEDFCMEMVPGLTQRGECLDVIICPRNPDRDYSYDGEPYGLTALTSIENVAANVLLAVDYQTSRDRGASGKVKLSDR